MKTRSIKEKETEIKWYMIDATGVRLGKVATKVAGLLMGKADVNRVEYLEPKNKVVVVNCEKVEAFPKKLKTKIYYSHSGYPGGFKEKTLEEMMKKTPEKVIQLAVKRMLPQNRMGRKMFSNLNVVKGADHKFEAQKPVEIKLQ
ncbi:50S ribosomal protein L13 [Candidatus Dojkabacteria bacterium]|nr:50S ribosomal protein L13 [Candidatus Dojkabacteria bacterium]